MSKIIRSSLIILDVLPAVMDLHVNFLRMTLTLMMVAAAALQTMLEYEL